MFFALKNSQNDFFHVRFPGFRELGIALVRLELVQFKPQNVKVQLIISHIRLHLVRYSAFHKVQFFHHKYKEFSDTKKHQTMNNILKKLYVNNKHSYFYKY